MSNLQYQRRPTLLVGYGGFGLDVLRRLLTSTVLRGVLMWQDKQDRASASDRYIQDLALLWVKDPFKDEAYQENRSHEGSALEMMRDLYGQIKEVKQKSTPDIDFANAVINIVENQLLSASMRDSGSPDALPLGLDVLVIAQPDSPEVIGLLNRMLQLAMRRLAGNANLKGASALNFIQIVDFNNYWAKEGEQLRQAMYNSVKLWQRERNMNKPAFQRIYLVDGRTRTAIRDERYRIAEITLFLEFLLFEGQRIDFQSLYQTQGPHESPVAGFGIRVAERSSGLLSRLAAAYFGTGWLEYLAGTEVPGFDTEPRTLIEKLAPYRPDVLEKELGAEDLKKTLHNHFTALSERLKSIHPEDEQWPRNIKKEYDQTVKQLEAELTEKIHKRYTEITEKNLANLAKDIRAGIHADLHDSRQPVPLGTVIRQLETSLNELNTPLNVKPYLSEAEKVFNEAKQHHTRYLQFREERLNVEGLKQWWLWFSLMLSIGLSPVAADFLVNLPPPDKGTDLIDRLLTMGYDALQFFQNPIALSLALLLLLWLTGRMIFQKRIKEKLKRTGAYWYTSENKYRFYDFIAGVLEKGSTLRKPSESFLEQLLNNMATNVRMEVKRELERELTVLKERKREILWLREQLQEFLKMNGVTLHEQLEDIDQINRAHTDVDVRYSIERMKDLSTLLQLHPPGSERYRSTQSIIKPFEGWNSSYSEVFLYPLNFIDKLADFYKDPKAIELSRSVSDDDEVNRGFVQFIKKQGMFSLSFFWKASQQTVPPEKLYSLLPASWRNLHGIIDSLTDINVNDIQDSQDSSRSYLLKIQTGVNMDCLRG